MARKGRSDRLFGKEVKRRTGAALTGPAIVCLIAAGLLFPGFSGAQKTLPLESIKLPPGFHIELYAGDIQDARSMTLGSGGTLFVGSRQAGRVYAVTDRGRKGEKPLVLTIAKGLDMPNGVAFRENSLYVAEAGRILRYDDIEKNLGNPPKPVVVYDRYPKERDHGWKFIAFGPDGRLYIPVGAPCNICEPEDPIFATITSMKPDGSDLEIYARGIRNSVGFDWHPISRELWFTDNGRDWMGDNRPPDELNYAPRAGMNFGFPYCHGADIPDPKFGKRHPCSEFTPPAMELGPHVAALGMRFYTGEMFPASYRNQIFIAEHGSWNRTVPIGYRITLVRLEGNRPVSYTVFAEGWLQGKSAWGRPVDIQVMPDGALLVSDDKAGEIYRITYKK